jgi:hypothetical protein
VEYPKLNNPMELKLGADTKAPLDGGLNIAYTESAILESQSPNCVNVNGDDKGTITNRKGQAYVYPTSLGIGVIQGLYGDYKGYTLFVFNNILYKQIDGLQPTEIYRYTGAILNGNALFFVYNSLLYINCNGLIKVWNGTTLSDAELYIPTIKFNRKPDGSSGNDKENLNLLIGKVKESFSSDGTAGYQLSYNNLDSIDKVWLNGAEITTGFTKNPSGGNIRFDTAPPMSIQNNVIIQYTKNSLSNASDILNCTKAIEYQNRIWLTGNINFDTRLWKSGIVEDNKSLYFPSLGYSIIGNGYDKITGFCNQYDKLLIFKEKSIYYTFPQSMANGDIGFPYKLINDTVGCDMPNTIQLVNNIPLFCNSENGVYAIVSTMLESEKNLLNISENINGNSDRIGLLGYSNEDLKKASSFDFEQKYYLNINNICYVLDYSSNFNISKPSSLHWYYYTNINALQWFTKEGLLCYADKNKGQLVRFINANNDFGAPVLNLWQSKLFDFNVFDHYKNIVGLWFVTKPNSAGTISIKYYNERGELKASSQVSTTNSFNWNTFNWTKFNWTVYRFPPTIKAKIKMKNISYFQLEFSNSKFNEVLSIINVCIQYRLGKKKR